MAGLTRRALLVSGGVLGGGLVLGYFFTPQRLAVRPGFPTGNFLATWVGIAPDGQVTILVPHAEMGQGTHTALAMMLAEELDADWSRVRVEQAPGERFYAVGDVVRGYALPGVQVPDALLRQVDYAAYTIAELMHTQITGGSSSVRFTGQFGMRRAGAAARQMLLRAAAQRWQVPVSECGTEPGRVRHHASGRTAGYGELAAAAATVPLETNAPLKPRRQYRICGKPLPRIDIPPMVTGATRYGLDVQLPGMKFAAIRHAPVFGGTVVSVDRAAAARMPGVQGVFQFAGAVAAVADSSWQANRVLASIAIEFDDGAHGQFSSRALEADFARLLAQGQVNVDRQTGDGARGIEAQEATIEADYAVPFLAHATMEPANCTAWFREGRLEVWAATQDLLGMRHAAARAADLGIDRVLVHAVPLGGGFGRRVPKAFNYVEDAVRIAMQVRFPIKLVWTREEDVQHDYYRPAAASRFRAALGPGGLPQIWDNVYVDIGYNDDRSAAFPPYRIPHQRIGRVTRQTPVPLGFWRSVEHSSQGFFLESFLDELANAAQRDPLEYRLALLEEQPRHRTVLSRAAKLIGWGSPGAGRGQGIALKECFGSIVAEAAEVSWREGRPRVERIAVVVDPGEIINPDIARAQMEGGVIFGLSAALYGRISMERGRVQQGNFSDYEMLRLAGTPEIMVEFVESGAPVGGLGEVAVPPLAAAVTNAIHAAGGPRIRRLPILAGDGPVS